MKKIITVFLTLFFVVFISGNNKQEASFLESNVPPTGSPEETAALLVKILSEKNYGALVDLTLTKTELEDVINASEYNPATKQRQLVATEDETKDILIETRQSFDRTISTLEGEGLLLKDISYKTCDYELRKESGIYTLNLYITINYRGNAYNITAKELVKSSDGWRFTGNLAYKRKLSDEEMRAEEKRTEQREKFIQDSIVESFEKLERSQRKPVKKQK